MKSKKVTVNSSEQNLLYMVSTPIGNLGDITVRALEVFENVEWVAAEDTRQAQKLFRALEIQNRPRFHSLHAHSSPKEIRKFFDLVANSKSIAYVSDAGTPGISDPGAELVTVAVLEHWKVVPIPGVSALSAIVSVLGSEFKAPFHFYEFIPRKSSEQSQFLERLAKQNGTHIFFESPKRIIDTLSTISSHEILRAAPLTVGRELTKLHEEILRGTAMDLHSALNARDQIKGEFVVALHQAETDRKISDIEKQVSDLYRELTDKGLKVDQKTFVSMAAILGLKRNPAYELYLNLQAS